MRLVALLLTLSLPLGTLAQDGAGEDVAPGFPFKEGDAVSFDQIEKLKDFLPPEFWANHEYFFYEGMELQIGKTRDYSPSDAYKAATEKNKGMAKLGRDGALESPTRTARQ